jgi:hypothetical protein
MLIGFVRRQSRAFWALCVLLVLDAVFFVWAVQTPSGEDCIMPGPTLTGPRCTAQAHVVGPIDFVVLGSVLVLMALVGLSYLRHRPLASTIA